MNHRINKLRIAHFRGASLSVELPFNVSKPILLIYGENGSGKSTIIDAIDLVCNQSRGSIALKSSTNFSKHAPTLGKGFKDVEVELTTAKGTWCGTLSSKGITITPRSSTRLEDIPSASVLRRSQMLRLIEAEPSKRYDELRRFIDVGNVEKGEDTLRTALKASQSRLDRAVEVRGNAEETLTKIWKEEGASQGGFLKWAKEKSALDISLLEDKMKQIEGILDAFESALRRYEHFREARSELRQAEEQLQTAEQAEREVEQQVQVGAVSLMRLLQEAQRVLRANLGGERCPVCEQPAHSAEICDRISERLREMEQLDSVASLLAKAKQNQEQKASSLKSSGEQWFRALKSLAHLIGSAKEIMEGRVQEVAKNALRTETEEAWHSFWVFIEPYKVFWEELQRGWQADIDKQNGIRIPYEQVLSANEVTEQEYLLNRRLKQMEEVVRTQRNRFTDGVLSEVCAECNRLYAEIHPDEPLGKLNLEMKQAFKGSIETKALFGESQEAPQAYYSEAHLDTLGFCLFMAIAKSTYGREGILVLDDVFTSVDADHADRIAALLLQERQAFAQIIITTHARAWQERFKRNNRGSDYVEFMDLRPWGLREGIRHTTTVLDGEALRLALEAPGLDRQVVCGKAGYLLESVLDQLTILYRVKMPRNEKNAYTLQELIDGAGKTVGAISIEKVDGLGNHTTQTLVDVWDQMIGLRNLRNMIGAHYNAGGVEYSDQEVRQFGELTLQILERLTCSRCGAMATRSTSSEFVCHCRRDSQPIRMTPPPPR